MSDHHSDGAPLVRIAELEIDPERLDDYLAMLAAEIRASVAEEPGVIMLHAVAIRDRPASIRLFEVYANEAAYQAHLTSPHFVNYKIGTADMVRSLRLIETRPIVLAGDALHWPSEMDA